MAGVDGGKDAAELVAPVSRFIVVAVALVELEHLTILEGAVREGEANLRDQQQKGKDVRNHLDNDAATDYYDAIARPLRPLPTRDATIYDWISPPLVFHNLTMLLATHSDCGSVS